MFDSWIVVTGNPGEDGTRPADVYLSKRIAGERQ